MCELCEADWCSQQVTPSAVKSVLFYYHRLRGHKISCLKQAEVAPFLQIAAVELDLKGARVLHGRQNFIVVFALKGLG